MSRFKQLGFSAVEVCIGVLVVAAIGFTGYFAYSRMQDANNTPTATEQTTNGTAPVAPVINSTKDLDSASKALNDTNVDASVTDSAALDSEASNF